MVVANIVSEKVDANRNLEVFRYMEKAGLIKDGQKNIDKWSNSIENITSNIDEGNKNSITNIHYKHFALKWAFLAFVSYVLSCFLFHRLGEDQST
jgi:hypothetical protein